MIVCAGHTNASADCIADALRNGLARLHPSVQRDVAAHRARAGRGRRGARTTTTAGAGSSSTAITSILACSSSHCAPRRCRRFMLVRTPCRASADASPSCSAAEPITVADGKCVNADGTLAGSDLDMAQRRSQRDFDARARAWQTRPQWRAPTPPISSASAMNSGALRPGYRASFVLLDDDFEVAETWIDGVPEGRL